ncbi:hypothetical protein DFP73DRAFT_555233 [Morchella snyderi]|nr:hypothetical protein DFP73DRAFT_555233 [Morchella snyderi]
MSMDPVTELQHLKFTPRTSAWKHMQRFERLCALAYPRATDAGKWSLFVKTIDTTNVWGSGRGVTPGRWLMELSEDWLRKNPHCAQPDCNGCKNDTMSFDYLKNAFLDRWGAPASPHGKLRQPSRSHSMPPPSESDGDPGEILTPSDIVSNALIPRGSHYPPSAPTPPNEPVNERERLVQETKTSIAINPGPGSGSGQIVLSISDTNKPRRKKKEGSRNVDSRNSHRGHHGSHDMETPLDSPGWAQSEENDTEEMERRRHEEMEEEMERQRHEEMEIQRQRYEAMEMQRQREDEMQRQRHEEMRRRDAIERQREMEQRQREEMEHRRRPIHVVEVEPAMELVRQGSVSSEGSHKNNDQALVEIPPSEVEESTIAGSETGLGGAMTVAPPLRPRLLEGKICAITGASRGIGRAIALGFAKEGAHIVAHYWGTKSDPANEEIVSLCVEIRGMGQGCTIVFGDISDPRTSDNIIKRAVETYGKLDVAVGNAGMCWYRDFLDVTPELLRRHVEVNLNGNFYFVQACARQFKSQFHALPVDPRPDPMPDYSLIFLSAAGAHSGNGHQSHYNPTAAGLVSLMQSTAVSLGPYGVRCNALLPGVIQTKMNKEELTDMEKRGRLEKKVPLGRLGVPSDIVGPAVWLAGEGAKYVSGAQIVIDGGAFVNNY